MFFDEMRLKIILEPTCAPIKAAMAAKNKISISSEYELKTIWPVNPDNDVKVII